MPDKPEVEKPDVGISTPPEKEKPEMIEKAKFDERDVVAKQYEVIKSKADALGYDDVEEYLEDLEIQAVAAETPPAKPDETKVPDAPKSPEKPVDDGRLDQVMQTAAAGVLEGQYATFHSMQRDRKEEDRCTMPKKDLDKLIRSTTKGPLINQLARDGDFGNNLYLAAEHYNLLMTGKSGLRQQGADSEKALENAAESAKADAGNALNKNESDEKTWQDKMMDSIAPDDPEPSFD